MQVTARSAMLQQAELSYADLSVVCNGKTYQIVCWRCRRLREESGPVRRNVLGPGDLGLKQRTQDMAGMITGMIFHLNSQSGCACYGMYYRSTSTQVL